MKTLMILALVLFYIAAFAQKTKTDLTKDLSSGERKLLIESLKMALEPELKLKPKMVVTHLWLKNGFAFFSGKVKDASGKNIDFKKTAYREALEDGVFDGDATMALLKKTGGKWKVLTFVIGPTDVPYTCWWQQYKAPKEIFDYTENCQ